MPAVIGASVHSGWAVIVAVGGDASALEVIDRRRIEIIDPQLAGAKQPYHYVESWEVSKAEAHLELCRQSSRRLAAAAMESIIAGLRRLGHETSHCAIVLAAGRTLPELAGILSSHALIHTAEGEFFRQMVREACEDLGLSVTGIRQRDLEVRAPAGMARYFGGLGRKLGPPWTQDHKSAAVAAGILLTELCGDQHRTGKVRPVD